MNNRQDSYQLLTRRMALVGVGKVALFGTLLARLFHLQIIQRSHYRDLAEGNRIKITPIMPIRGEIHDRRGHILAGNRPTYFLNLIPEEVPSIPRAFALLQKITQVKIIAPEKLIARINRSPRFLPFTVAEGLSWNDVCTIEVNLHKLRGFAIRAGHLRSYPYDETFAHVIGHVHHLGEGEKLPERFRKIPSLHIGKTGVEKIRDDELLGIPGIRECEVNAHRREVRELSIKPSHAGKTLQLTISHELQTFVYQRLNVHQSGSCIVVDLRNGDILALVSAPGFNPNVFSTGLSSKHWGELLSNPAKPLLDKALSGLYPPGSIFKIAVALAALEEGFSDFKTTCTGKFSYGNHTFHCWKKSGHGTLDLEQGLQYSCDVMFYTLAQKLGSQKIYAAAKKLGFGEKSGLGLQNEKSGHLPSPAWKKQAKNSPWTGGDTINMSIGQGYLQATPLQLAIVMARIASGKKISLRLYTDAPPSDPQSLEVEPGHLARIRKGLWLAVNKWGTANQVYQKLGTSDAFAKTSTVQVKRISDQDREKGITNADLPWHLRDHAMITAALPLENPRYALAAVIDHGGGGGRVAAPFAGEVLKKIRELERGSKL